MPEPQPRNPSKHPGRQSVPWLWIAATLVPIVLALLVLKAMLGRALMPAQSGYLLMLLALGSTACWFVLQLGWRVLLRRRPAVWYLFVAWLPAAIGGWLAVRGAWVLVEHEEVRIVERELAPLTSKLATGAEDWAGAIPASAPAGLAIWRGEREYFIAVQAGSIDIDGSTLYLDSNSPGWQRFYDGSEGEAAKHFEERTASLKKVWPEPKPKQEESGIGD